MNDKIFVQIASYRDPQLLPTIKDLLANAENPEKLTICIAWQHSIDDIWDNLDEYKNDSRFIILDIDYKESKGCCWARNLTQLQYTDEYYILQLDSHHRFAKNWDTICKSMISDLQKNGYDKPLLTAYLPSYDIDNENYRNQNSIFKLSFEYFTDEGIILIKSDYCYPSTYPIKTRFLSGHFIFTLGSWNKEVLYDPNLYFHGEEISLAVRSFTHGYDLFAPNKIVCWHEYKKLVELGRNRKCHWEDHYEWHLDNKKAFDRIISLLNIDNKREKLNIDLGIYGLGNIRTLEDYEKYSGIRFSDRAVQQYTIDNLDPPNPSYNDKEYIYPFKYTIHIWKNSIDIIKEEYDGWVVAFENDENNSTVRLDVDKQELYSKIIPESKDEWFRIERSYNLNSKNFPKKWVVWPYNKDKWFERFEGIIEYPK